MKVKFFRNLEIVGAFFVFSLAFLLFVDAFLWLVAAARANSRMVLCEYS